MSRIPEELDMLRSRTRNGSKRKVTPRSDAVEFVRRHSEMFLPWGECSGDAFASMLVLNILATSTAPLSVIQEAGWWIIASEDDWISRYRGALSVEDYFSRIVPFPEAGANSMHWEVTLSAFASRLIIATPGDVQLLLGPALTESVLTAVSRTFPNWKRLLAFQLEELIASGH